MTKGKYTSPLTSIDSSSLWVAEVWIAPGAEIGPGVVRRCGSVDGFDVPRRWSRRASFVKIPGAEADTRSDFRTSPEDVVAGVAHPYSDHDPISASTLCLGIIYLDVFTAKRWVAIAGLPCIHRSRAVEGPVTFPAECLGSSSVTVY